MERHYHRCARIHHPCIMGLGGWRLYNYYYNIGVPVSVTPEENIQKLAARHKGGKPTITLSSDSILGVALNMYRLENLQAEISLVEPDTTDTSVWMYSRSADHTSTNEYLGSLVMNGKELASDVSRLGYCAMANGNIVLGISRSDKVKDYVEERGGSFFRQFIWYQMEYYLPSSNFTARWSAVPWQELPTTTYII